MSDDPKQVDDETAAKVVAMFDALKDALATKPKKRRRAKAVPRD